MIPSPTRQFIFSSPIPRLFSTHKPCGSSSNYIWNLPLLVPSPTALGHNLTVPGFIPPHLSQSNPEAISQVTPSVQIPPQLTYAPPRDFSHAGPLHLRQGKFICSSATCVPPDLAELPGPAGTIFARPLAWLVVSKESLVSSLC